MENCEKGSKRSREEQEINQYFESSNKIVNRNIGPNSWALRPVQVIRGEMNSKNLHK